MIERLPERVAIDILSKAYLTSQPSDGPLIWREYGGCNPLRTVAPLVCKAWNELIRSPAAGKVFFRRVRIVDACILPLRRFKPDALLRWFKERARLYVQELEVNLSSFFSSPPVLERVSQLLCELIAAAPALQVLHLTGELELDRVFDAMPATPGALGALRSVHLARGGAGNWGVASCVAALACVPSLTQLQVIFRSDLEEPPPGLPASIAALRTLRHLALTWPTRSALPPAAPLPDGLGDLAQLTTLQLRRVPATCVPGWLGRLAGLRHLYWDLCLPADVPATPPPGLDALTGLRTLYIDLAPPLALAPSLAGLRTLVMVGHAAPDAPDQDWDWLAPFTKLRSLRIQGGGMRTLPPVLRDATTLTRLSLNNNRLSDLPDGPWLAGVTALHLGSNRFGAFPRALRSARALQSLHLANQRDEGGALRRGTPELTLEAADVAALCTLPALRLVVLAQAQPRVRGAAAAAPLDYSWLQRALAARRVRLTSNELAFELESLPMFDTPHVGWAGSVNTL
ncbi:NUP50A [Auxenochlorella protothecoides x Auxenochlorella symbiontica]|uniref:Leucine-rich repeat-containing protein 40 n=2 Tax=Auxenochlorella protothecoides TaxID=3075 RepID=A0A087SPT8_AUXPR|nr:Leucine-rich repeat-containing protein 40 [Auxenochlorella protothecoides]KFM27742.1 Leucine-rich repeat-containing protein 40 [Auxenochlorella protothecoides]